MAEILVKTGDTATNASYKGKLGEVTLDTQRKVLIPHDGVTVGGMPTIGLDGTASYRFKFLTGTTAGAEGGNTQIAHGLTGAKIIGIIPTVEFATNSGLMPHDPSAGYSYRVLWDATNVIVYLHATESENILNKPIIVLVIYEI